LRRLRRWALPLALVVALLAAGTLTQASLRSSRSGAGEDGEAGGLARVDFLDFLGGVRQFVAYSLWVRGDRIHHGYYGTITKEAELIPYYELITLFDPHSVDAYYVAAETIYMSGQPEEAIRFTLQGIENNPDSGDLHASLADLYIREGRYEEARQEYLKALGLELRLVDEDFVMEGVIAASKATGDAEGAAEAGRRLLGLYRMRLADPSIDDALRAWLIRRVNDLAEELTASGEADRR